MIRAIKLSLSSSTASKRSSVGALLREYRSAINFYCRSLWEEKANWTPRPSRGLPAEVWATVRSRTVSPWPSRL